MSGRIAILACVLFALALTAQAARPCDNGGLLGLRFVPFPTPVPTPGGHVATGVYVDDRPAGGPLVPVGVEWPALGVAFGDGTWIYLETNGQPGLQRGGCSSLPTGPFGCEGAAREFEACSTSAPDEMLFPWFL